MNNSYDRGIEMLDTPERLEWARKHVYDTTPRLGDQLNDRASNHLRRAINEGWGPVGESAPTIESTRKKALQDGAWRCPNCPDGWSTYSINRDKYVCTQCEYAGG